MAWVVFERSFPYVAPDAPARTVVYPAGAKRSVTHHCASAAVAAGAAKKIRTPTRAERAQLQAEG